MLNRRGHQSRVIGFQNIAIQKQMLNDSSLELVEGQKFEKTDQSFGSRLPYPLSGSMIQFKGAKDGS